jgi:hypothetical protein
MKLTPGEVAFPMVPAYVKSDCYIPSDFSLVFIQYFFFQFLEILELFCFENFNISENNIISVKLAQVIKVVIICSLYLTTFGIFLTHYLAKLMI